MADFEAFGGGHCFALWAATPRDWRCPGCDRTKFELLRWAMRDRGRPTARMAWGAALHRHHDHDSTFESFDEIVICGQCNHADGMAKRWLGLPVGFSFAPGEIGEFITAAPHRSHRIDLKRALELYRRSTANPFDT